jgi:hypothetical protein
LINAIADSKIDKNSDSAKKLYDAYLLDKRTLNLYYAASTYVNAKEYDRALKFTRFKMNYSGTNYLAVNKLTGEKILLQQKERQNGKMEPMKVEVIPSKEEIYKNMALILVDAKERQKGD